MEFFGSHFILVLFNSTIALVLCVIFVDGGVSAGECDVYVSGVSASELC